MYICINISNNIVENLNKNLIKNESILKAASVQVFGDHGTLFYKVRFLSETYFHDFVYAFN